jgi:phage shock protein PspC (stress-responsive transcriptional regulator)
MEHNPNGPAGVDTDRLRDVQSWRRSRSDRMIAGVCGGIGRALNVDPVLIRVVIAVLAVAGGVGIPLYVAAWVLMPEEGSDRSPAEEMLGRRARPDHPWLWPVVICLGVFFAIGISSSLHIWPFSFPGPLVVVVCIWFFVFRKKHRRGHRPHGHGGPPRTAAAPSGVQDTVTAPVAPSAAPQDTTQHTTPDTAPDTAADTAAATAGPVWTEDDPLGLYVDEPPAVRQPDWAPAVRQPRHRWVKPVVATAAVLAIVIAWNTGTPAPGAFAIGLATLGLGMVAGAFLGRTRGLLPLGLVMVVALALTSVFHSVPDIGDVTVAPTDTINATNADYRIGLGSIKVDLTNAKFAPGATVHAHADVGDIEIILPPNVDVVGTASVAKAGSLELLGQKKDGHGVELKVTDLGADGKAGPYTVIIDAGIQLGDIKVVRR